MTYADVCVRYFLSNKLVDFCKYLNITTTLYSGYENSSNPEEGAKKTINNIVDSHKSRVNLFKIMCVDLSQYVQKNTLHIVNKNACSSKPSRFISSPLTT